MTEQTDGVTIRRLPDGNGHLVRVEGREGPQWRVTAPAEANRSEFGAGTLVEVQCEKALYLGEVVGRKDTTLLLAIEHTVDRAALAAVQSLWRGSPGE